jgi:hypothetical protein
MIMTIENFAAIPFQEQMKFAEALLKTINSENTFTSDTNFEIDSVEADELTGGLAIRVSHPDTIDVSREATWTCDDEEDASVNPGSDADYVNGLFEDVKSAFKTLSTVIDGYNISLEIDDVDVVETVEVEVDSTSYEDGGIGSYEYWGETGYDSSPYVEVEGTIIKACDMALTIYVEPVDEPAEMTSEEAEEN